MNEHGNVSKKLLLFIPPRSRVCKHDETVENFLNLYHQLLID